MQRDQRVGEEREVEDGARVDAGDRRAAVARAADRTEVVCEWFFEPAALGDTADAVEFWDQVNREDWEVCGLTQLGMESRSFVPGRYTTQEGDVHRFDLMVAGRYLEAAR